MGSSSTLSCMRGFASKHAILVITVVAMVAACVAYAHWPTAAIPDGTAADRVVVRKAARTIELYRRDELIRSYPIALGRDPIGHKRQQGDGRTPEGRYVIDYRKEDSAFHRALHISYPSDADVAAAEARGVNAGGLIMIHGIKNGRGFIGRIHTLADWTDGCIAVTDSQIEEIWRVVPVRTPIVIEP